MVAEKKKSAEALKVELWSIDRVRPYPRNPRRNESAIDAVAASLREFGFRKPIVVDVDGVIVCGHTCFAAAQRLGLTEVPVHVARDLSPERIKALRIADNKTAELAEWDWEKLAAELAELEASDFDVAQFGFTVDDLAKIFDHGVVDGLKHPDEAPPSADKATTRHGDLWILGDHRLLCGDSAAAADVDRLLGGERVQLVNTDPPYGVAVEPRGEQRQRAKDRRLLNDDLTPAVYARQLNAWFHNLSRALEPGRSFYIWGGYANFRSYPAPLDRAGLYFSQAIVWKKNHPVLSRQDFNTQHEWCFYGWLSGAAHQFFGPNNLTDVWEVDKVPGIEMVHLTQKPVELAVRALQYSSRPGETVLDLFGGSGSTLIAAQQTGRRARLMELDPCYCDVIVRRWEEFTGNAALREAEHGETKTTRGCGRGGEPQRSDAAAGRRPGPVARKGGRQADRGRADPQRRRGRSAAQR